MAGSASFPSQGRSSSASLGRFVQFSLIFLSILSVASAAPQSFRLRGRNVHLDEIFQARQVLSGHGSGISRRTEAIEKRSPVAYITPSVAEAAALVAEYDAAMGNIDHSAHLKVKRQGAGAFWMESVAHGSASFNGDAGYKVFRNVKDYGAKGDGVTDDTAAINRAITDGNRCGQECGSSTVHPAVVYLPSGKYLVSSNIIMYYNTQIIGNPNDRPVIIGAPNSAGISLFEADPYVENGWGSQWYVHQSNFLRQMRNLVIDISNVKPNNVGFFAGIHWQVAQATSLQNIEFVNSNSEDVRLRGLHLENGSGGFFSDLTFTGGALGMYAGAQQFTTSRLTFKNVKTAINMHWNWAWTLKSISIDGSDVGINFVGADDKGNDIGIGSAILMDSKITNTKTGIVMVAPKTEDVKGNSYLVLDNVKLESCEKGVEIKGGNVILQGGSTTIESWTSGKVFTQAGDSGKYITGGNIEPKRTQVQGLMGENGFLERSKPQYEDRSAGDFLSVKDEGAKGDGRTDDTAAIQSALNKAAGSKITYFPAGTYIVTSTIKIPKGSKVVGEAWSQIMGAGAAFSDMTNPKAVVQVGQKNEVGDVEIQDILFTVKGATAGAIVIEWNIKGDKPGSAAMWDSHVRIGGAKGSELSVTDCPKLTGSVNPKCIAGSALMHATKGSSGYFENIWLWVADHDMDIPEQTQIDIYVARGLLIESTEPSWYYGTASEHCVLYQYSLASAQNVFMGMIQTESPYFQPTPVAPEPFTKSLGKFANDPKFECEGAACKSSWGLILNKTKSVYIYGAGLYSWFSDYKQECLPGSCQKSMVLVDEESKDTWIYNLVTIGTEESLTRAGAPLVKAPENLNNFGSTIAAWLGLAAS